MATTWALVPCTLIMAACLSQFGAAEIDPRYEDKGILYAKFPNGFLWGTATSSYQVEGAFNTGGRGPSIWDTYSRTPNKIKDNSTGDVACDSYHRYEEDIALMKKMGVQHYRFSISWSRVMPDGTNKTYNQEGMDYYIRLVEALVKNDITPLVTLYHWDLPQALQDQGGWQNDTIVTLFDQYARTCFAQLGNKVKWWLTFNEPWVFCFLGYGTGAHAPGIKDSEGVQAYRCAHNVIRSHALAYRSYSRDFRSQQKGKVSITLNIDFKEPNTSSSPEDQRAAYISMQFQAGWFAHPIYKNGDYPDVMKELIGNRSIAQGLPRSRLPTFTDEEKRLNNGSFDYFGLNHYTTGLLSLKAYNLTDKSNDADQGVVSNPDPQWTRGNSSWLYVVPWGLRKLLRFIRDEYNNPPVIITENGVSVYGDTLQDQPRTDFYRDYINNVLKAILNDSCDVFGYTAWSLLDNFEWAEGYTERFGLHHVDFNSPNRTRTPKDSAAYIAQLIKDNGFNAPVSTTAAAPVTNTTAAPATKPPGGGSSALGGAPLFLHLLVGLCAVVNFLLK